MSDPINKRQNPNYEGSDKISNLPDFIIGHILSSLPTREAVSTCVLSKRWIYLWTFITTNLCFNDSEPSRNKIRKTHFINFVYRVLLHLDAPSIQSFSLSLSENYDPYHVNQWISAVLNRRVKEICIDSKNKLDNVSPHSLWTSQSLEKLVLKINASRFRVPNFACLSSLAFLKISGIKFICYPSNESHNLILNFPVLREFEIGNCRWLNVKRVTLEVPKLEVFSIKYTAVSKSDELHTVIKFCAPRLTEFSYCGHILDTILLDLDLSTARIASAEIHPYQFERESEEKAVSFACEILKQFNNNVECLKIDLSKENGEYWPYELFLPSNVFDLASLPEFGMLNRLELGQVTGEILLNVLRKTPFLETLIFKGLLQFDEELSNPANVPSCFIACLQVVTFGCLNGKEHELRFAKFVMDNAQDLKRVSFTAARNLRGSKFEKVKKKIISFKKKSVSDAVIDFPPLHN